MNHDIEWDYLWHLNCVHEWVTNLFSTLTWLNSSTHTLTLLNALPDLPQGHAVITYAVSVVHLLSCEYHIWLPSGNSKQTVRLMDFCIAWKWKSEIVCEVAVKELLNVFIENDISIISWCNFKDIKSLDIKL